MIKITLVINFCNQVVAQMRKAFGIMKEYKTSNISKHNARIDPKKKFILRFMLCWTTYYAITRYLKSHPTGTYQKIYKCH